MKNAQSKSCKPQGFVTPLVVLFIIGVVAVAIYNTSRVSTSDSEANANTVAVEKSDSGYVAGILQAFTPSAYASALEDGKTVMLDFHADWCSVCIGNEPKAKAAFKELNNKDIVGFKLNYDKATAQKREFGVNSQSTLILLKDGKEVKRTMGPKSVGDFKTFLST